MELSAARHLARTTMDSYGLSDWGLVFDRRKYRFGACKHDAKIISLSAPLVRVNEREQVLDTILHEIAHALVGPNHYHDRVWKDKALSIGCNGKPCYSSREVNTVPKVWVAECPHCHKVFKRYNAPGKAKACPCTRSLRARDGFLEHQLVWRNVNSGKTVRFEARPRARVTVAPDVAAALDYLGIKHEHHE